MEARRLPMEVRAGDTPGEVVVRASCDTCGPDAYGTVIEVEGLMDWLDGYREHRTVNLEHDLPALGGRPMVGVAVGFDFDPQLVVRVRLLDEAVAAAVADGRIRGASLEFVPDPQYVERRGRAVHYRRLLPVPELTGLALTARPAVPGAEVLEVRTLDPNWRYAVIDPAVLEGRVADPAAVARLRWFPHHDVRTRRPVPEQVMAAIDAAQRGEFEVPEGATLTAEQVRARAIAHLERHLREIRSEEVAVELEVRGMVPSHGGRSYGRSERPWSAPTLRDFGHDSWPEDEAERRRIAAHFAWAADLDSFGSLKLPHHEPSKTGLGPVNKRGVIAAIAALNGARGGVDIPREDRRRVYAHLARHLRDDFDTEPPPLKRRVLVLIEKPGR